MNKTILILGIIFLLVGISLNPTIAVFNSDDVTPPVTTYSLDPATPDGNNGWYVSDVNVTLNATDDMSGVKEIKYRVDGGVIKTITGDNGIFIVDEDGDNLSIEYWAIDNAENEETHHIFTIDMDQTDPIVDLTYEIIEKENLVVLSVTAIDMTSKMNRVEFHVNDVIYETVYGSGPYYIWNQSMDLDFSVEGFISNISITDDYVKFFAIRVFACPVNTYYGYHWSYSAYAYDNAGNLKIDYIFEPEYSNQPLPIVKYTWYTFANDYEGHIYKHYIRALFEEEPINVTPGNINFQFDKLNNRLLIGNLFLRFLDHFPLLQRLLDIWRHVLV